MFPSPQHIHFVGIGGVGMAGIAEVLLNSGYSVSGSDLKGSAVTEHLERSGAAVSLGHDLRHIPAETTVVVISSAVSADNIEIRSARERKIPVLSRGEMLGELMRAKHGVAVSGTHGKTTTTTMIGRILAEFDPTVIVGGRIRSESSGVRLGSGEYLVTEADESDGSFRHLRPVTAVVTNIEAEHLNYFGTVERLEEAFLDFLSSVPFYGTVVACFDDPVVRRVASRLERRVISYGLDPSLDYSATDVRIDGERTTFSVSHRGAPAAAFSIPLPGVHMAVNALAAIAVGTELGVTGDRIRHALSTYPGVARRSEIIGRSRGVLVIDDYGHHPTEIRATLKALRQAHVGPRGRLIAIFQPHRFTRTRDLFSEFQTSFGDADEVIIGDIYSAGEEPLPAVSAESLARAVDHPRVRFSPDFEILGELGRELREGDVVVTIGAGSIGEIGPKLLHEVESREA